MVHGAVHGTFSFPELLVMMSLVKDAERIGDYAKNIFDLAVHNKTAFAEDELADADIAATQGPRRRPPRK